jgi:hypothetical protein
MTDMKNRYTGIHRIFKLLILFGLVCLIGCNNKHNSSNKQGESNGQDSDTVSSYSKVPKWLVGTWKGKFSADEYGMTISFTVAIAADGTIVQTSTVPDEEDEILKGKCISVDGNTLSVGFENQSDDTIYYLDEKSNKLGISGNNWLTKK